MKIYIYKNVTLGSYTYTHNKNININKLVYFSVFSKKKGTQVLFKVLHQMRQCHFVFLPKNEKLTIVQLHVPHEFHTTKTDL